MRQAAGKWIAFALMNKPVEALQQSFLRTKARNYWEYITVAGFKANSSNNTLFADSRGNIAFLLPQFMPIRDTRFDYRQPVDGSDPATDWKGLHSLQSLPQAVNPRSGWAFNTNNWPWTAAGPDSPVAANYPRYFDSSENDRGRHAVELLTGRNDFTPAGAARRRLRLLPAHLRPADPGADRGLGQAPRGRPAEGPARRADRAAARLGLSAGAWTRPRPRWPCSGARGRATTTCSGSRRSTRR